MRAKRSHKKNDELSPKQTEAINLHLEQHTLASLKEAAKKIGVRLNDFVNTLLWMKLQETAHEMRHSTTLPENVTLHKVLLVLEWTKNDDGATVAAQLPIFGPFSDYLLIESGEDYLTREYTIKFKAKRNP